VLPTVRHVEILFDRLRHFEPRFVCVIHYKVRDALNRHPDFRGPLQYGICGPLLVRSTSAFVLNYFPNGNNLADSSKLDIFRSLRDQL
jgi:hypothetical protein